MANTRDDDDLNDNDDDGGGGKYDDGKDNGGGIVRYMHMTQHPESRTVDGQNLAPLSPAIPPRISSRVSPRLPPPHHIRLHRVNALRSRLVGIIIS